MSSPEAIREAVRDRYAAAARRPGSGCCGEGQSAVFGGSLYDVGDAQGAAGAALEASLGCGVPTAVAELHDGDTVRDLGSGAGADVLISARRVARRGGRSGWT